MGFPTLRAAFLGAATVLAVVWCLLAAGCTGPDMAQLEIVPQATPFYWYEDTTRIYLRTDSSRLTVEAESTTLPALSASLSTLGVTVDTATAMGIAAGHWVLSLHPGTSPTAAVAAARALRLRSDVRFASNAYLSAQQPASCTKLLVNRFAVQYKASVATERIVAFQERAGFGVERSPSGAWSPYWVLRYPVGSPYTPLEIVAAVYHHPYVEWADADRTDCIGPSGR
jgi:hypothetical protein